MHGAEWILAAMLLYSPPESSIPTIEANEWPAFRDALFQIAKDQQLLDPREQHFLLRKPDDLKHDLNMLRRRHQDLHNAPRLEEADRFPPREAVNAMLGFNRSYRENMEAKQMVEPHRADFYADSIREADRLHEVWDHVRDARCDFYYITVRRQALKKLKEATGEAAFTHAAMPPCVPLWRFEEIK
jgi:hypothetical protein